MKVNHVALASLCLSFALSAGCVSPGEVAPPEARAEYDPWEPYNRRMYNFNTALDNVTTKPLAKGYQKIVPRLVRTGVSNFFDNLWTPATALNQFLQGKPGDGFSDVGRFLMNSTVGLGGLLDVGTEFGLEEHDEDFGQTLAVWGVGSGPYFVMPIFGPSTVRDTLMYPLDLMSNPLWWYENSSVNDKLRVLRIIDTRAGLLQAEQFLEDSNNPYITLRESYLQNREYKVYDGNPPMEEDPYEDLLDFEEEE